MKLSKKAIEVLWAEFANCPINDMEEIVESFCGWTVLTDREEIWRWFDEQYAKWGGVHALMFPSEHKKSCYGEVMAEVNLQVWVSNHAFTFESIRFDCAKALDYLPFGKVAELVSGRADYDTDEVYYQAAELGLVKEHDGPFDCVICDGNELKAYIKAREEA